MEKAKINVSVSGIRNSLMHMEARKPGHPATLFITWCRVSEDNRFSYSWQLMSGNEIKAGDTSARTVTHAELGRDVENLIKNVFLEDTTKNIDQEDYSLLTE